MSKRAWMPLYVGDYLGDTGHLSTSQHGAYLLLMMHYWRQGGLPDDDKQLAAITKLPLRIWLETRETIQGFFYDGWFHKRIDEEIAVMEVKRQKRAVAGSKGGTQASINRMRLENLAHGRSLPQQNSSNATAMNNHSHSHNLNTKSGEPVEPPKGHSSGRVEKVPQQASPELLASMARRQH